MQNKAVEQLVLGKLNEDTQLMSQVGSVFVHRVPRAAKLPYVVINLVGDTNTKAMLSQYSGNADLQCDIFSRNDADCSLRHELKMALRRIRGGAGGLTFVNSEITGDSDFGVDGTSGLRRWIVSVQIFYLVN